MLQLSIETPVQHVKRKLVKPRVILAGSNEGEEKKKKKVRIRDKNSGRIIPPSNQYVLVDVFVKMGQTFYLRYVTFVVLLSTKIAFCYQLALKVMNFVK